MLGIGLARRVKRGIGEGTTEDRNTDRGGDVGEKIELSMVVTFKGAYNVRFVLESDGGAVEKSMQTPNPRYGKKDDSRKKRSRQ